MSSNKVIFKKSSGTSNVYRKMQKNSSSSEDDTRIVKRKAKQNDANHVQSSRKFRKSKIEAVNNSSESEDDKVILTFKSKRTVDRVGPADMGATSVIQTETEKDRDAQAVLERQLQINKQMKGLADDKLYRGLNNYSHFYEKKDSIEGNAASGSIRKGPIRAPDHIRSTVRWDYQPDICKDFKETGFCGFGDSCKFLHDRTDYKFGWQLEGESNKCGSDSEENYEIPSDEEYLPFKCLFCRQSFVDPVRTKCNHYFCEKCALEHFKKSVRCYVCDEKTKGIFIPAANISSRLGND